MDPYREKICKLTATQPVFYHIFRMMMQLSGDIETLTSVLNGTQSTVLGSGSCSALIKLAPGNSELFVAHATFTGYQRMLRILKKYNLNIQTVHGNSMYCSVVIALVIKLL